MRPMYYKRDGTPYEGETDYRQWAKDFSVMKNKRVAVTELPWGGQVSTVWLGLDHNYTDEGPPLIFESMVFPEGSYSDLDTRRYSTEIEALQGHKELVEKWKFRLNAEAL